MSIKYPMLYGFLHVSDFTCDIYNVQGQVCPSVINTGALWQHSPGSWDLNNTSLELCSTTFRNTGDIFKVIYLCKAHLHLWTSGDLSYRQIQQMNANYLWYEEVTSGGAWVKQYSKCFLVWNRYIGSENREENMSHFTVAVSCRVSLINLPEKLHSQLLINFYTPNLWTPPPPRCPERQRDLQAVLLQVLSGLRGLLTGTRRSGSELIERPPLALHLPSSGNRGPLCLIPALQTPTGGSSRPSISPTARSWRANLEFSFQRAAFHYELYSSRRTFMNLSSWAERLPPSE